MLRSNVKKANLIMAVGVLLLSFAASIEGLEGRQMVP